MRPRRFIGLIALQALFLTGCSQRVWTPPDDSRAPFKPGRSGSTIRIASWNIQWLGTPAMRKQQPEPCDIADYIQFSGADILSVQELTLDDHEARQNKCFAAALDELNRRTARHWTHRLLRACSTSTQCTAIAWDQERVVLSKVVELRGVPTWDRVPHAAYFSAGEGLTDFVVVPIHMRAKYENFLGLGRTFEAIELSRAIRRQVAEPDVLLIGDFNCPRFDDPALRKLKQHGWQDLNADDLQTHQDGALDRALVRPEPPFLPLHFTVLLEPFLEFHPTIKTREAFVARLSDHVLVYSQLHIAPDDD